MKQTVTPKITEGSKSRKVELEQEWSRYKQNAENLLKGPCKSIQCSMSSTRCGCVICQIEP